MGTGAEGGFALPTQFRDTILQVSPQEAIVRPRATVIPAGEPPDAKLEMPALDQTSSKGMYGGVVITHGGEGLTMTETEAALRQVSMEPKQMDAYIVCTNKLLVNWEAASSYLTRALRTAVAGAEDYDFLRGDGINKALGLINAPAAITVTRSAPNTIAYVDIYTMYGRAKQGGSLAWIASPTCVPQLCTLTDTGGHNMWVGGTAAIGGALAQPVPPQLMGLPVLWADRLPALGTSGDIVLADLSYYLVKDGSGPFSAISTELLFLSNRTIFKILWNVDGRPWLTEPIGLEGSTTNTVSPFVKLS
jgi:HK97 family phage major capsid protein